MAFHSTKREQPVGLTPCHYYGGAEQDRTVDLLTASQALSQLSYSPTQIVVYIKSVISCQHNI